MENENFVETTSRIKRPINYDKKISMRISAKMLEQLKEISSKENIAYQTLIKKVLEDFISHYNS